jgi:hypothetical protein
VREARVEAVFPLRSSEEGLDLIIKTASMLFDIRLGAFWFGRIPGCDDDAVSLSLPQGRGREVADALVSWFEHGDLTALSCALIAVEEHFRQRKKEAA